jgi:hypothetical protein
MQTIPALLVLAIFSLSAVSCSKGTEVVADKWKEIQSRSAMDDTVTYKLVLESEADVPEKPLLVIACSAGKLSVFVNARTVLTQDPTSNDLGWYSKGRYRFGQENPEAVSWHTSEDHNAVFVPKEIVDSSNIRHQFAAEFVDRLAGAQVFHFEYSPVNGGPAVAEFDVRGLSGHLAHLKAQCPYPGPYDGP